MKYLSLLFLLFLCSCQTGAIKMTDKYEDKAFVYVPSHVEAMEVNGRRVRGTITFGKTVIEIPVGRTELVFRFYSVYDTQHGDDHEKVYSDKLTAVFVSEKNNNYEIKMPEPDKYEDAVKMSKKMKGHVLHRESGTQIEAIQGVIEERFHGIKIMRPYEELKHWWKKSTQKEKDDFLKWIKDQ